MINSPTGNYHCEILIGSFLSGQGVSDAFGHFNLSAYRKLRYFEEFERPRNGCGRTSRPWAATPPD